MRSRSTLRRLRRFVTGLAVVALAAPLGVVGTAAPAAAWDPSVCVTATAADGCFVDRYQDPTVDFGDLDNGSDLAVPDPQGGGVDSTNYPWRRSGPNGAGVTFRGLTNFPYTASGTDISFLDPSLNGGKYYLPCKNPGDTYKGACMHATDPSYHQGRAFTGGASSNAYPSGYLIGNRATCNGTACTTYWGNKVYGADFEFYPRKAYASGTTDANYVRPRFGVRGMFSATVSGNGWNMTADWGSVPARHITHANVGRLQGYVYASPGVSAPAGRVVFSMFQRNTVSHAVTSTGKPLGSFFAGRNTNGYWTTGAVYAATFDLVVRDTATGRICKAAAQSILSTGLRVDLKLYEGNMGRVANNWSCYQG